MSIASELARLRRAKKEIKEAIEDKGVDVPNNKRLDDYDDYVKMIRAATDPLEWGKIIGNIEDQEDLMELLSSLVHYEIYADLSEITEPKSSILYLIGPSGDGEDEYEEYVYVDGVFVKIGDVSVDLSGKQDVIDDLADIRSGAAAGATAVQPGDLPTVPTISTDIDTDKASDTKTASPKAVADYVGNPVISAYVPDPSDGTLVLEHKNGDTDTIDLNHNHPQYALRVGVETSQPSGGMAPNTLYNLGTLTGSVTIALDSPSDSTIMNEYMFTFDTGSTAPIVIFPPSITAWLGNCLGAQNTPEIVASKHYEVSVLGGIGFIAEV